MFRELMAAIWEEFARIIFHVEVNVEPEQAREMFGSGPKPASDVSYRGGTEDGQPSALREAAAGAAAGAAVAAPQGAPAEPGNGRQQQQPDRDAVTGQVVKAENEKLGRNDPCWCGSGKKFKNCHGG